MGPLLLVQSKKKNNCYNWCSYHADQRPMPGISIARFGHPNRDTEPKKQYSPDTSEC